MKKTFKRPLKYFLFSGFIFSILFGTSFCVHQKNKRNLSSMQSVDGWEGPKTVHTPAGSLYVYHKVIDNEPANITYVDVKYTCKGEGSPEDWKRFKVQWFYGVEKTLPESVVPLVYSPIAELNFSGDSPDSPANDNKTTVKEEFNLKTRCQRD